MKITFVKKDLPLALKIKEVINGGTIEHPKNSDYLNLLFLRSDVVSIHLPSKNCCTTSTNYRIKKIKLI